MAIRTFGKIIYDKAKNRYDITEAEPHVSIKLKSIFPKISVSSIPPYHIQNTDDACLDLLWFMDRYPMEVSPEDLRVMKRDRTKYIKRIAELESIHTPNYQLPVVALKNGEVARDYQLVADATYAKTKRLLLGDDIGLGKTLSSLLSLLRPGTLPAAIVVQTHLPNQWQITGIEKFTNLKVHIIQKTTIYNLPPADVYIFKYSALSGWVNFFTTGFFKSALFDEIQELRRSESQKHQAGKILSAYVQNCMGMSATPIYNYGDEIYNIMDVIKPGCLGNKWDFLREWATPIGNNKYKVVNPKALGTYLREQFLFLRRTRADVGRELPPINTIIHTVDYDHAEVAKHEKLAVSLAMKVVSGSFVERGNAARELDILARQVTGISKAKYVAEYVKILLDNGEPVILAGWHREVYTIWLEELSEYQPAMYTGSESGKQKQNSVDRFLKGETDILIMSLRSGAGVEGLQERCKMIVYGEIDYSPKVHEQLTGRANRDRKNSLEQVTAIYLVSDEGSDPVILDILGLKSSQSHGIVDPLIAPTKQYSDESRIRKLAEQYLNKNKPLTLFN